MSGLAKFVLWSAGASSRTPGSLVGLLVLAILGSSLSALPHAIASARSGDLTYLPDGDGLLYLVWSRDAASGSPRIGLSTRSTRRSGRGSSKSRGSAGDSELGGGRGGDSAGRDERQRSRRLALIEAIWADPDPSIERFDVSWVVLPETTDGGLLARLGYLEYSGPNYRSCRVIRVLKRVELSGWRRDGKSDLEFQRLTGEPDREGALRQKTSICCLVPRNR